MTLSLPLFPGDGTEDAFQRDGDGGMRARIVEGPGTYYVGIIDILQEWNYTKVSNDVIVLRKLLICFSFHLSYFCMSDIFISFIPSAWNAS